MHNCSHPVHIRDSNRTHCLTSLLPLKILCNLDSTCNFYITLHCLCICIVCGWGWYTTFMLILYCTNRSGFLVCRTRLVVHETFESNWIETKWASNWCVKYQQCTGCLCTCLTINTLIANWKWLLVSCQKWFNLQVFNNTCHDREVCSLFRPWHTSEVSFPSLHLVSPVWPGFAMYEPLKR